MARPRRQGARRRQLVQAASLAIAEQGLAGLRLKHIADRSGLSIPSVLYYYPDLDDLVVEVHAQALETFYWDRVRAAAAADSALDKLVVTVEHGIPNHRDNATLGVIFELHVAASRSSVHADLLTTLWQKEVSLYREILDEGSAAGTFSLRDSSDHVAETVVALEDAFDLHLTSNNSLVTRDAAVRRVLSYLEVATNCSLSAPLMPPREHR